MRINQVTLDCLPDKADSNSLMPAKDSASLEYRKSAPLPMSSPGIGSAWKISGTFGSRISASEFAERVERLMSLRAAFHASLQACSESGWVNPMSGGSGIVPSKSVADYDPASRTLRTRQQSLALMGDGPGTELCAAWPRSGLIVGGSLFPLPSLVRDISANAFSSSLPTPIANDSKGSDYCYGKDHKKILKLGGAIKKALLPIPTAADGERGGRGDLLAILEERPNKHCNWTVPPPTAADGLRGPDYAKASRKGSGTDDLVTYVCRRLLPTPPARDFKDTPGMATEAVNPNGSKRKREDTLPRQIYAAGSKEKLGGMKQTPEFRCWLMGFPQNWLKPLADLPEMQSSRKLSNPSPGQS